MRQCGPNQRIIVTGFLDDDQVDACFRRSDLFVFPTLAETFGIVVLQAMSQGLPVVASRVGGIPFFLKENCGELVDPGDADQLAKTVEGLARDPERCQTLGANGRVEATKYTWDSAAETAAESYERVLKKKRSASHAALPPRQPPSDRGDLRARASDVGSKIRSSQHVQNALHTLVDQGIVSLGNFVLQIVLARNLIPADYGYFALLMTLFFLVQHVHLSLVLYPLTLRVAGRETKDPSRLTSTSVAVVLASSAVYALAIDGGLALLGRADLLFGCAAFLILWQTQDAMRQALMAGLRHRDAIWGDAVCYLGQAAAIGLLVHFDRLTLPNALLAMAVACFAAMLVHGAVLRPSLPSLRLARENVSYFWHMGRWAFLNGSVIQVRTHMFTWALVGFGGTAAAGAYQAAMNIANFTNPVIFGMSNIIAPIAARTLKESGLTAAWQAARTYFLIGAPLIFGYCAVVFAVPYVFLHLCYSADSPYLHLDTVVRLVVLAAAVNFLAEMTSTFLLGISRGNSALVMNTMAIAAAFVMLPLVGAWGVTGAAIALTVANSVRLIGSFFALRSATTEPSGPALHARAPAE
jgi:O-antigen/teichoic acid export membrane protein